MRTQATTNTRKTKSELSEVKKKRFALIRAKLLRLWTWDKISTLPLNGDLAEGPHPCLWHDDEHPSAYCWTGDEGYPVWYCHACQRARTAIDLVGLAYGLDGKAAWKKALELAGGRKALGGVKLTLADLRAAEAAAEAKPKRWPVEDARQILSVPLPAVGRREPSMWLESRGLSAEFVDKFGLAFATPQARAPWWMWGRSSWDYRGYGLVVPLLSIDGQRVSFLGRQTHASTKTGEIPKAKCTYPADTTCDGLLMANWAAWRLLLPRLDPGFVRYFFPDWVDLPLPTTIEIAEGVPDFLRRCESTREDVAVLGIFSGSWTQALADKIPDGALVKVFTHSDDAGMIYQRQILKSLGGRCTILVRHRLAKLIWRRLGLKRKLTKDLDEVELYQEHGPIAYAAMGTDGMWTPEEEPDETAKAMEATPPAAPAEAEAVAPETPTDVAPTPAAPAPAPAPAKAAPAAAPRPGRPSAADLLVQLCDQRGLRVRPDGAGVPCAEVPIDGAGGGLPHPISLKSKQFAALLRRWLYEAGGGTASDETIKRAVKTLAARIEVDLLASDGEAPELWTHDADNATRLERHVQERAIHTPVSGWLTLTDGIWARDAKAIVRLAEEAMRKIPEEAEGLGEEQALDIHRWGVRSLSESSIKSAISLASARQSLSVKEDDLDKDDFLLGTLSGVLDLRTMQLVADPAKHLVTRRVPVKWDPTARAPRFLRFLDEVFAGNREIIDFLQRLVGYFLTGCVDEHILACFHGAKSRNGKSTLLDILLDLFGWEYAHKARHTILSAHRARGEHKTDRDQMRGRRLTLIDEWPRGASFDEAEVKAVTGAAVQSGRDIGKSESNYRSTTKGVVATNWLIEVSGDDNAIWNRMMIVPFEVSFLGREDRGLLSELRQELPGILAWGVLGAQEWMRQVSKPGRPGLVRRGLDAPPAILEYTAKCREQMDDMGRWAAERLIFDAEGTATPTELAASWADWCEEAKIPAGAANRLTSRTAVGVVCARWGLTDKPGRSCSRMVVGVQVAPTIAPTVGQRQRQSGMPTPADLDRLLS